MVSDWKNSEKRKDLVKELRAAVLRGEAYIVAVKGLGKEIFNFLLCDDDEKPISTFNSIEEILQEVERKKDFMPHDVYIVRFKKVGTAKYGSDGQVNYEGRSEKKDE